VTVDQVPSGAPARSRVDDDVHQVLDLEAAARQAIVDGTAAAHFDHVFTDTAVLVLPGMILERAQALAAWSGSPLWQRVEVESERTVHIGQNAIAVTYRARLVRWDSTHDVHITSVYTRARRTWRLGLRQQMPIPPFMG
jgi:hypothetical protein